MLSLVWYGITNIFFSNFQILKFKFSELLSITSDVKRLCIIQLHISKRIWYLIYLNSLLFFNLQTNKTKKKEFIKKNQEILIKIQHNLFQCSSHTCIYIYIISLFSFSFNRRRQFRFIRENPSSLISQWYWTDK